MLMLIESESGHESVQSLFLVGSELNEICARPNDRFVKPKLPQNLYYFEIILLEFPVCCLIKRFGILGICV